MLFWLERIFTEGALQFCYYCKSIQTPAVHQKSWQGKLLELKMFLQNKLGFRDCILPESLRENLLLKGTVKHKGKFLILSAE